MTTFNSFANILPDPLSPITDAGNIDVTGTAGPGFASVTISSNKDTQVSRTISGRGVQRESGAHHWEIQISYNPMLREMFDPVETFLESRNARLNPFFVVLPQHQKPKDANFAAFVLANTISCPVNVSSGLNNMMISAGSALSGTPKPGDVFNVVDPNDANHLKTYKITAVETNSYYQAGSSQPSTSQARIHFNPPLVRNITGGATIRFIKPQFRVVSKTDTLEYTINTDNLYSFSLALEEIQP